MPWPSRTSKALSASPSGPNQIRPSVRTPSTSRSTSRIRRRPRRAGRRRGPAVTAAPGRGGCAARRPSSRSAMSKSSELGPSDFAAAGSSWISMKSASMPTAAAARASGATNCRSPPVTSPAAAGELHRVGGVEADRHAQLAHHARGRACPPPGCRSRSVAPRSVSSTFSVAGLAALGHRVAHVARGQELPLLHVHRACRAGRRPPPGRSAGRGRPGPGGRRPPRPTGSACQVSWTSVRHGQPGLALHLREDGQARLQPRAAEALARWSGWPCRSWP